MDWLINACFGTIKGVQVINCLKYFIPSECEVFFQTLQHPLKWMFGESGWKLSFFPLICQGLAQTIYQLRLVSTLESSCLPTELPKAVFRVPHKWEQSSYKELPNINSSEELNSLLPFRRCLTYAMQLRYWLVPIVLWRILPCQETAEGAGGCCCCCFSSSLSLSLINGRTTTAAPAPNALRSQVGDLGLKKHWRQEPDQGPGRRWQGPSLLNGIPFPLIRRRWHKLPAFVVFLLPFQESCQGDGKQPK